MGVRRLTGMNSEAISVATQSVSAKTEPHEAASGRRQGFCRGLCVHREWSLILLDGTPGLPGVPCCRVLCRLGAYELRFPRKKSVSFSNGIRFTRS